MHTSNVVRAIQLRPYIFLCFPIKNNATDIRSQHCFVYLSKYDAVFIPPNSCFDTCNILFCENQIFSIAKRFKNFFYFLVVLTKKTKCTSIFYKKNSVLTRSIFSVFQLSFVFQSRIDTMNVDSFFIFLRINCEQ